MYLHSYVYGYIFVSELHGDSADNCLYRVQLIILILETRKILLL